MLFMFHVCLYYSYTVLYVPCSLIITCWERADIFALLCVMFTCVIVTFPYGVSGQVWYLIVSITDLCPLLNVEVCNMARFSSKSDELRIISTLGCRARIITF